MKADTIHTNELAAARAFNQQAVVFDELYSTDQIIQYKRARVREHVMQFLPASSNILELNSGTGEDAVFFAGQGNSVHATDISEGMQDILTQKIQSNRLQDKISYERCSYSDLASLEMKGPYDLIFSNFAGLNCTNKLESIVQSFSPLLKPNGWITLVILPKFCLWEFLLLFRGKFKTAFRRFSGKKGSAANVEGVTFRCWYYRPSSIKRWLKADYNCIAQEGLCTIVPPSYMENFAEKHPAMFRSLKKMESRLKSRWPWKNVGDYFIITLQKKG